MLIINWALGTLDFDNVPYSTYITVQLWYSFTCKDIAEDLIRINQVAKKVDAALTQRVEAKRSQGVEQRVNLDVVLGHDEFPLHMQHRLSWFGGSPTGLCSNLHRCASRCQRRRSTFIDSLPVTLDTPGGGRWPYQSTVLIFNKTTNNREVTKSG